jgi:hypothetical protein
MIDILVRTAAFIVLTTASAVMLAVPYIVG